MINSIIKEVAATFSMAGSARPSKTGVGTAKRWILALLMFSNFNHQQSTPNVVMADQPVHCLRGQLYGVWNFHVSKQEDIVNLFNVDEVCTHKLPNKL